MKERRAGRKDEYELVDAVLGLTELGLEILHVRHHGRSLQLPIGDLQEEMEEVAEEERVRQDLLALEEDELDEVLAAVGVVGEDLGRVLLPALQHPLVRRVQLQPALGFRTPLRLTITIIHP